MKIEIDYKKCCWKDGKCTSSCCGTACEGCVEACSTNALKRENKIEFDESKCIECGACVEACKHDAISLIK